MTAHPEAILAIQVRKSDSGGLAGLANDKRTWLHRIVLTPIAFTRAATPLSPSLSTISRFVFPRDANPRAIFQA